MSFPREFADNLREARRQRGMTQSALAQQIGVTPNSISMYENAKRMPTLKMTSIMSGVLDVSLDDLVPHASYDAPVPEDQMTIFDLSGEDDV